MQQASMVMLLHVVVCGATAVSGALDASHAELPSLLMATLTRDEELLLRRHLPEWRGLADCFLVGVDDRTQDSSEAIVREMLGPKPVVTYLFRFEGFGPAKSSLLKRAHKHFPTIDYVLLVEPDMQPILDTFDRGALRSRELVYAIRRAGKQSLGVRLADSIFLNDGNWRFKFRVHETPIYKRKPGGRSVSSTMFDSGWSVVEQQGSVRDTQPRLARLQQELELIELDRKDHPGHPRLVYYAGTLRYELALEMRDQPSASNADSRKASVQIIDQTTDVSRVVRDAIRLLSRRARDPGTAGPEDAAFAEQAQQRSAAAYYCARAHRDFLNDARNAESWYRKAIELEPDFLHAHVGLVHLLFSAKQYFVALEVALLAESAGTPRLRLFMDSSPLQACDVPLLISKAIYYCYVMKEYKAQVLDAQVWLRRVSLLEQCLQHCPKVAGESAPRKLKDALQLQQFWAAEGFS